MLKCTQRAPVGSNDNIIRQLQQLLLHNALSAAEALSTAGHKVIVGKTVSHSPHQQNHRDPAGSCSAGLEENIP